MRNKFARYINSFPGMTVWMFGVYFIVNTLFFGYSPMQSAMTSAIMAVVIAGIFSRNLHKNTPFFAKNIEEGRFDRMRRFKKYLQKGELPPNKDEYADFSQYLQEAANNHAKKSLNLEKTMVAIFGVLGLLVLAVDTVQTGLLFVAMAGLFTFQIKASAKARRTVPLLQEKLRQLTGKQD